VSTAGRYGMSANHSTAAPDPAQLVLGFGNLSETAIRDGLLRVADLVHGTARRPGPGAPTLWPPAHPGGQEHVQDGVAGL
jgi:hypothetical protein